MTSSQPPESSPTDPEHASFAERLKQKYGEGVDPEVSLDRAPADTTSGASSELLRRLADHSLKQSRYKLQGEIARGGMGAIIKVWDEDLRRTLAMKVILGKGESTRGETPRFEESMLARFLEEAQVTGQLDHPGIVPVHELGLDSDGRVYFTMKLVKGRDLKAVFELVFEHKDGWNETRALSVILRACEAMAYAHKKGVIHRDLKPANIMVGNFGEVYVMDWGLARVLGQKDRHDIRIAPEFTSSLTSMKTERRDEREERSDSPLVTMDGAVMGTPSYMSPEQARGEVDSLGPRSDVYSMGALLYHLLARRAPYTQPRVRISNRTVLAMVLNGPPPKLSTLHVDVPAEIVAIVEKAMSREASERYADTLVLAEDLRAFLEHRVVGAYETGAWAEAKKWVHRNKPLAASLAGVVVLLVGGLTMSLVFKARADENAALASKRADETVEQSRIAKQNETRAVAGEQLATQRADELARATKLAQESEALATRKANDVLSLSAIQELKELVDRADALWPAQPENLAAYEEWLAQAKVLVEGNPADPAHGVERHPSLADHESKLAEIRLRAKPLPAEQVEADRRASAHFDELEHSRGKLTWMRRMLGEESWPTEASVDAELARQTLPADPIELNDLAWKLIDIDPAKIIYGSEVRGLLLARRAVAATLGSERAGVRDTLGWALYRCGRFDEAFSEEQRAVDEAQGKRKDELDASLRRMREEVGRWRSDGRVSQGPALDGSGSGQSSSAPGDGSASARAAPRSISEELAELWSRASELEREVSVRRTYQFEDAQDRWWHAQLAQLVNELKALTNERTGGLFSSGTSAEHGWGIRKRAEFARTIGERSIEGSGAQRCWREAIASIRASPRYGGLSLTPQLGLLPIGLDPNSHLWEFAHLQTGEPPQRSADGKLLLTESMGLVFVLIPGGTFKMGAQSTDPTEANFDRQARADESPVHDVTVSAYFLSKYEMTQGQWLRFVGSNPSHYGPHNYSATWNANLRPADLLQPVEKVSWIGCTQTLGRLGLELPTEAEWERAARAETDTPWWTGSEVVSLNGAANLSDSYGRTHGAGWTAFESELDDGNTGHAAIGSYAGNNFGLHDVIGNVWEWCWDGYGDYHMPVQIGDATREVPAPPHRVLRGGSFAVTAASARSALRQSSPPEDYSFYLGLRPARAIAP